MLTNLARYGCIPHVAAIAGFFAAHDPAGLADGLHPVAGDDVVFRKSRYCLREINNTRFESHRLFFGPSSCHRLVRDHQTGTPAGCTTFVSLWFPALRRTMGNFFTADRNITDIVLAPGMFLFLFAGEPHRPGCVCGGYDGEVLKGVVKVQVK